MSASTVGLISAIGAPRDRLDGKPKTSGAAHYAGDTSMPGLLYGVLAQSTISNGRIVAIDTSEAAAAPGIAKIFTPFNAPKLNPTDAAAESRMPLQDDRVYHEGQHIALVLGETLEETQHAVKLLKVSYAPEPARADFTRHLDDGVTVAGFAEPDTFVGDVEEGLRRAQVRVEATYTTADRHHVPIEPSATLAHWHDGRLDLIDATQYVFGVRVAVAAALGIAPEKVRVRSPFAGGGFGCKGFVWPHVILAAMAAREAGRPVKLVLTRAQTFTSHGYQPATVQKLALGATREGTLTAIRHESWTPTSTFEDYFEICAAGTRTMYACPAIETRHRAVRVNRGTPTPMRAPHEGPGMVSLEIAMDELAGALGMDPLELRLRNHAEKDPGTGKPYSQKNLRECYRIGAKRFGWANRPPLPATMRDGNDLVGWGMATAIMTTFRIPATARVTLDAGGSVLLEAGTHEIGTGATTIAPQIVAAVLDVPVERVRMAYGDTALPETGGTFGSSTTLGVGSAVLDAAVKLKERIAKEPSGWRSLSAEGAWSPGPDAGGLGESDRWSMYTFGAVFAEVRIDDDLRIPRVGRIVGVYSAGRIINPKTARSQIIGGMTWGIGQALLECSEVDPNLGRYLSKNLAGYLVPVNADVGELDVSFIDEVDEHASLLGAKGIGELGAVGVGPAIANAVYHATGKRVRNLPIRPEALL